MVDFRKPGHIFITIDKPVLLLLHIIKITAVTAALFYA